MESIKEKQKELQKKYCLNCYKEKGEKDSKLMRTCNECRVKDTERETSKYNFIKRCIDKGICVKCHDMLDGSYTYYCYSCGSEASKDARVKNQQRIKDRKIRYAQGLCIMQKCGIERLSWDEVCQFHYDRRVVQGVKGYPKTRRKQRLEWFRGIIKR
ncbi:MAG: hypothetical protein F4X82_02260 [Candidatus Spechtbacteria bacterium SB0662_bin_43]|uniref:Uncharacterized protein n=1 Tax=Candidatus Spechtbacteria bacterium SB0662_bin_43 TaxID=2604897 RepID=A0A845D9C8_9BACT|nr:hypothetical protein [Candidatus Spechtbacteria bacterium SB0662_bin_43]